MQKQIDGWDILYIHEVPMGHVLNAETAKNYLLKESGSWISEDRNWMLQHNYREEYELIPNNAKATEVFFNIYDRMQGSLKLINKAKTALNNIINGTTT